MNTRPHLFRGRTFRRVTLVTGLLGFTLAAIPPARAADKTWSGSGPDRNWKTPGNWVGGAAPVAGDSLFFGGTFHTTTTNNFAADTMFGNLTFNSPAGFFSLNGNEVALGGNITNNQVVTEQAINLPLALSTTPTVDVTPNGVLTFNGVISGSAGLMKVDDGLVNLNAANTFTGDVTIDAGTVAVGADNNLGAGNLVLDGGRLETTASFGLGSSRGIAVGPGWGGIKVDPGTTLSYGGIIADNGGMGALVKNGYGELVLSGQNTYTGATSNRVGALTLDFSQAGAPADNIIPSGSDLTLGGENAGTGLQNEAQLNVVGADGATSSQTFNSTHLTFAQSIVQVTSGAGGTANLNLGPLSHDPGGTLMVLPPQVSGGAGSITTTSPNVNGILGGWAVTGDGSYRSSHSARAYYSTNYVAVDGSGNIVSFNNYFTWSSGNLYGQVTSASNLLFAPSSSSVITVDNDNADTLTEVNAIKFLSPDSGTSTENWYGIFIGAGNTLRLGQYGGILKVDDTRLDLTIGGADNSVQSGHGASGSGDIGTVTAGGADNTPGEIVIDSNNHDESHGTIIFEAKITDNGTAPVTVVKTGPGSIKLDGHNTFSGGLYLLQGRVQFAGSEIGNDNPDGGGTGPIYVLPGAYLFPSGVGSGYITNELFIAGGGDADEPIGAIRGGNFSGPIHLVGDAAIADDGHYDGPITGPFSLSIGVADSSATGGVTLGNTNNDWTGDTTFRVDNHSGSRVNTSHSAASEVIPNGFGKGNVVFQSDSDSGDQVIWDLAGFNETINGLSTTGPTPQADTIENLAGGTTSTLTIGDNNQSGTFAGLLADNGGMLALTKIGGGIETLTGANTYSGQTTVNGGTLAVSGSGSIASSTNIQVNSGATLDVSDAGLTTSYPLQLNGGALVGNASVGRLTMNGGALTLDLNPSTVNVTASGLTLSGSSNVINIGSVFGVGGYPASFPIIQYSGSVSGAVNFVIGSVPNASTGGFFTNDTANSRIVLVLTNGPAPVTWVGGDPVSPTFWDNGVTTNWLAFKGTPNEAAAVFQQADPVIFDDTADTNVVNLTTKLQPGFVTVNNSAMDYTFTGSGSLSGSTALVKDGSGMLTLLNTGGDSYKGGVVVKSGAVVFGADNSITGGVGITNGASVQVGIGAGAGTLPAGNVVDQGALTFNRGANLAVSSDISGAGTITEQDTNVLTLSGNNSGFTGAINAPVGTLKAGSGNALGTGTTTVSSGATLDVNGQTLDTTAHVVVSGTGIGGQGAIVNSGADNIDALGDVTLAGDTTVGGTGRWDIRGGPATLSTSGNPYTLTKIGDNQVSLVGVTVDAGLGDINVESGTFSVETTTSGLGDSSHTLTVSAGATLQFYGAGSLDKQFVLNGSGTNTTLNCGNGTGNTLAGPVTVNGACVFNAGSGDALTFSSTLSGGGSVTETGSGSYIIASSSTASYTGGTTVGGGTLIVDGSLSGAITLTNGGTLAGMGTAGGDVAAMGGTFSPGDPAAFTPQSTLTVGNLTLDNATGVFELSSSPASGNDQLAAGNLTLNGTNTLQIVPLSFMSQGDTYTLITYTGATLPSSATNQLRVVSSRNFFTFAVVDPSTTPGSIQIKVLTGVGNDTWTGAKSPIWNTNTLNWTRNSNPANFNNGDVVTFDDSTTVTNVSLSGALAVSGISEQGYTEAYTFGGAGSLTGPGGLDLEGISLTIANAGTNTFTGPVYISSGILQLGNGGTNGNLGSGAITNNGMLIFNRSDDALTLSNDITSASFGIGVISNAGPGTVTLAGANNNFQGTVVVGQGTLRTLNSAALGDPVTGYAYTYVHTNATLDIGANAVELGDDPINVAGAGVGGNGAIINSSGDSGYGGSGGNFYNIAMTGDTTFGGTGRMDMRNSSATPTLSTGGQPYALTKVGDNLFQLVDVFVDPALGDINIQGGTLGFQGAMSFGNSTSNLTVFGGARLDFYDFTSPVDKVLVLEDGSTVHNSHSPDVTFDGPVMLDGTATFDAHSAGFTLSNVVSGVGGILKAGSHNLNLTMAETYTGDTLVNDGTLALIGDSAIGNSAAIILGGGTLDVSGRTDGTLTLAGQTLAGNGTITGTLMENAGALVNPGNGTTTAALNVSVAATLNGSVIMDLNRANTPMSDEISAPSISASGTLTVTNIGPMLQAGDTFQLFSTAVSGFAAVNLPTTDATGATYTWNNNLTTDGSISVATVVPATPPRLTGISLNGTMLTLTGTNGAGNGTYVLLESTNVALPLAQWTPVLTNSFDSGGGLNLQTNIVNLGNEQEFYILQTQ